MSKLNNHAASAMSLSKQKASINSTASDADLVEPATAEASALGADGWRKLGYDRYLAYFNLVYLMFLFFPLFINPYGGAKQVWVTLGSLVIFLPLHFLSYRRERRFAIYIASSMVLLCYAVTPFNYGANTYLIFGVITAAYACKPKAALAFLVVSLVLLELLATYLEFPISYRVATPIMASMLVIYTLYNRKIESNNHILRLSQQEVQRLAQSAERERIGRDLHDVLGHTLSLIVMKSELASRLMERDAQAAATQIREVEKVARDALSQIRIAVSGIRLAGLEAELANARLALLTADVQLHYQLAPVTLASEVETVFALAVREAVTNIIRHAKAQRVEIELISQKNSLQLHISDDGSGHALGTLMPGNGLKGMRERLLLLGGELTIDTGPQGGVRLSLSCPKFENKNITSVLTSSD
jgi:two-component system, NarL family, sensor histidine kinase DesK